MDKISELLYKKIKKALKNDEVPVACLILKDGKVLACEHNKKEQKNDPFAHAEILCIQKAAKKLKTWNLNDCELYVTLEPCLMCKEVINEARIKKVYYYNSSNKTKNNNIEYIYCDKGLINKDFESEIKNFFKNKR